ncbi:MAG: hypothetical protein F6K47_10115 [Symploca sp. SIO2E6]|nr:hypothetical protein [Symploca sp. SIO2E6]
MSRRCLKQKFRRDRAGIDKLNEPILMPKNKRYQQKGSKGLSPPPESLIWWQAIGDGLKPSPYCSLLPCSLLPSAFFTIP